MRKEFRRDCKLLLTWFQAHGKRQAGRIARSLCTYKKYA